MHNRHPLVCSVSVLNCIIIDAQALGQTISASSDYGQKIALLGKNGCEKSTVIHLLERFYDSNAGSVFIDSIDIRNINLQWLRSKICYITQQPILFDGTIEENIAYGDLTWTIDRQELIDAAKQSNAHTFIEKLPQTTRATGSNVEQDLSALWGDL
ncbi:unnamed protein product [Didymodactylos carnosus]|uniref:ABC transporter domain-containing protein n=1 Tax=Didymodactylos carnosus TaxID=1234261 RepID=A0A8S2X713_9BILA|nr:unnamed protein product [Didymodactylos carnosus]